MAVTPPFNANFAAALNFPGSTVTFANFQTLIAGSPLLQSLLNAFTGTITIGVPGAGTATKGNVISVDPNLIQKLGTIALLPYLADAIAHELGHALLTPTTDIDLTTALNIGGAQQIGMVQEGSATLAEFIVAKQLKLKNEFSDLSGSLTKTLDADASSNGINVASITLSDLQAPSPAMSAFIISATNDGGAKYANYRPSIAAGVAGLATTTSGENGFTYNQFWADEWILAEYGYSNALVNWSLVTNGTLSSSGDSVHGWSWTAANIPLLAGTATDKISGNTVIVNGETLSFTGTEDAANTVVPGAVTLALGGSATITGGAGNDVFYGRPGNDKFVVNFRISGFINGGNAVERIVADPKGNGSLTIEGGSQGTVVIGAAAITATGFKTWTDGTNNYQFIPGGQIAPGDLAGLNMTGVVLGPSVGELKIANAGGSGSTVEIIGFDLQQSESVSGGFLGIHLPETIFLNASANSGVDPPAPNFIGGSNQSYTLSVDAPSTTAQTLTVTLSGAIPSDFEVTVGDTIEQINANGSFSIALAAGETNVSFGLIDTTAANGSSDIASGANLQLIASLPNPDTLNGSTTQSTPLTFSYIPQGSDTAPAPQATDPILGNFDSTTGVTTYTGDGGDDFITASGSANLINAQNSGNDIIIGGSSSNTIEGSAGNNVITVGGTSDQVDLGSGFNTVNGGSGHDSIFSASGDAIISANNGTDLILLGNGNNAIYGGSQTSLANAIAQAASGSATHMQGDLIAVHDGNNTIVGGNGNDLIDVGAGHDVIVLGPGNETFVGGVEVTSESVNWSTTITPPTSTSNFSLTQSGVGYDLENFSNPFPQPYNGSVQQGTGTPFGPSNDTVFGGAGNEFIQFGNGNNYLETGNGNDTVFGGVGNDTIIAGSGADTIRGGGGTTYIVGGAGADTLEGGDGTDSIPPTRTRPLSKSPRPARSRRSMTSLNDYPTAIRSKSVSAEWGSPAGRSNASPASERSSSNPRSSSSMRPPAAWMSRPRSTSAPPSISLRAK
jgi:hypothetical protein